MSSTRGREHALLNNTKLDLATAAALTAATAVTFVLVGIGSALRHIQNVDDSFLRVMLSHRSGALTAIAKVFNVLGTTPVTWPVRILLAGLLAFRRRWWHFAAFVAAMVISEVLIGTLKRVYDRPRPPVHPLVRISGASFPSGHAVATSVTVAAVVIAFVPSGWHRWLWGLGAGVFSFVMAVSRVYLGAHWLSDAVAGTLLGTTVALDSALVVQWFRLRVSARERAPAPAPT
jgi:membrane-associated phospholipid phosphatase